MLLSATALWGSCCLSSCASVLGRSGSGLRLHPALHVGYVQGDLEAAFRQGLRPQRHRSALLPVAPPWSSREVGAVSAVDAAVGLGAHTGTHKAEERNGVWPHICENGVTIDQALGFLSPLM